MFASTLANNSSRVSLPVTCKFLCHVSSVALHNRSLLSVHLRY